MTVEATVRNVGGRGRSVAITLTIFVAKGSFILSVREG